MVVMIHLVQPIILTMVLFIMAALFTILLPVPVLVLVLPFLLFLISQSLNLLNFMKSLAVFLILLNLLLKIPAGFLLLFSLLSV